MKVDTTPLRLRYLLKPKEEIGRPELQVLSVYRDHGVVPKSSRKDNFNKTPLDLSRYQVTRRGDLVINKMKAWQGSVAVSYFEGLVSPDYLVCSINPRVDARYLHFLLRSAPMIAEFRARSKGIRPAQWRLYWEDLADITVQLPTLDEQRRITRFLDAKMMLIDKLLAGFNRQSALIMEREYSALAATVSGARLGDGASATGVSWIPAMHPRAQVVPLIRALQLQRGSDLAEGDRVPGPIPVVTTAGATGWHDAALVKGPGVVIGRYGSVGNVHWVPGDYWPHNTTLYVRNFHGNNPRYCYHLLRSLPYEMEQARAAVPGVNRNDLHKQRIALLPHDLQGRVVQQMDNERSQLDETRERVLRAEKLLAERRQSLITATIAGQIDVSAASGRGIED
ncbi:hypothetical protein K1W54_02735 [Micromonospora sp. CPCC 205371]|nr:hypothetical protein [Micromonospora sp. CPCC 205371]